MLKNKNILLRIPEPEDIDFILSMENDSSIWNTSGTHNPFSRFDIEQYVLLSDKDIYAAKQLKFIIELDKNSDKKSIGAIDIFDFDAHNKRAGVGIAIIKSQRNRGYAKIALSILINYMKTHLNLHQIYCNIAQDNLNSIKLFESAGFKKIGIRNDWLINNDGWTNEICYQLIFN